MTHIFETIRQDILAILDAHYPAITAELPRDAITAEPPREASHGDIATNAAMVCTKLAKVPPREIAGLLVKELEAKSYISAASIAGPGFVNITLTDDSWQKVVGQAIDDGLRYGECSVGQQKKINVEFVSANPTGPIHIGHARGAVYGDVLCRLLSKAGYDVTREYYINDAGGQIETLLSSALLRYKEALGEDIGEMPEGFYPGEYLKHVGAAFAERYGGDSFAQDDDALREKMRPFLLDYMLTIIKNDLKALNISHDIFTSEKAIVDSGLIDKTLALLQEKGLLYEGILEPPKGQMLEDWEAREQTLFKATQFGDDTDRPLRKSNGAHTYFAADIAYHYHKLQRGYAALAIVLGADHSGYLKRLSAAVKALSDGKVPIEVKIYQLVNFMEKGEPMKMSKRAGNFLTLREVAERVGADVVRFMMLTRRNDMVLDFDFDVVTEQSKNNPVFYVQYAHARCYSIFNNAQETMPSLKTFRAEHTPELLSQLKHSEELVLIKMLARWPRTVETAALHFEPHRVVFYLQELAAAFHGFWQKGREDESLRFIIENDVKLTKARLCLVRAVAMTLAAGLDVVGISAVEKM